MSKQAQLPPRYPFQKKAVAHQEEPVPTASDNGLQPRHCKSISQSFISEKHPSWFDDLLTDSDLDSSGAVHRRSASDSLKFLDGHEELPDLSSLKIPGTSAYSESDGGMESACTYGPNSPRRPASDSLKFFDDHEKLPDLSSLKTPGTSDYSESDGGMESACTYGPNSPRSKGELTFPDNAVVSALSEFVSQAPFQYFEHSSYASEIAQQDNVDNSCNGTDATKRHQGKWSRVHKMQYIHELERTVSMLQGVEAEMAVKVSDLHQQRATLLLENSMLKQQMIRLQQEKLYADVEYKSLEKEAERLRGYLGYSWNSHKPFSTANASSYPVVSWGMLDMQQLGIGEN